jgi:hypothetical protein
MIKVVRAQAWHCDIVGDDLREGDSKEILDMGFKAGFIACRYCFYQHDTNFTALLDDRPIAMWGYGPASATVLEQKAHLWCMTTPAVVGFKKEILKLSKALVQEAHERFYCLESAVAPEYEAAVRWCHWLGFRITGNVIINGHAYFTVTRERIL